MGDAADDLYESEMEKQERLDAARARGDKPCPVCAKKGELSMQCQICFGLGWVDKHGEAVEI